MVKARRIYRRAVTSHGYLGNEQRTAFRVMDRRMLLYPLVFILCWGPGLCLRPGSILHVWKQLRSVSGSDWFCVVSSAVGLAFLLEVKPSAGQGWAVVALYISQVSLQQDFGPAGVHGPLQTRHKTHAALQESRQSPSASLCVNKLNMSDIIVKHAAAAG